MAEKVSSNKDYWKKSFIYMNPCVRCILYAVCRSRFPNNIECKYLDFYVKFLFGGLKPEQQKELEEFNGIREAC